MVSRIVVILGLLAGSCFGQSGSASTSIYVTLFTNQATSAASGTVPNIGQIGHQVVVNYSNAPAHTCPVTNISSNSALQYSYDNSAWFPFGTPSFGSTVVGLNAAYTGSGAFPFVRFQPGSFDTTDCLITAYYTGSSSSSNLLTATSANAAKVVPTTTYTTIAGLSSRFVIPIYSCTNQITLPVPLTAGTNAIFSGLTGGTGICYIAATTLGTSTVQLTAGTDATCTANSQTLTTAMNITNSAPFILGGGLGLVAEVNPTSGLGSGVTPYFLCAVSTGSNINLMLSFTSMP